MGKMKLSKDPGRPGRLPSRGDGGSGGAREGFVTTEDWSRELRVCNIRTMGYILR